MPSIVNDTCDRCGPAVRAAVSVRNIPIIVEDEFGNARYSLGRLTFCGHHADRFMAVFLNRRYLVTDYREPLGAAA